MIPSGARAMRIAMISTPFVPVPPPEYGGTELVVAELQRGLRDAGHDVTLFATGDSEAAGEVRALYPTAQWPPDPYPELDHTAWALEQILTDPIGYDLIHAHVPAVLPLARLVEVPIVYTVHHARERRLVALYERSAVDCVAVSARQRELSPELASATVIHHGLSPERYPLGAGDGGYVTFLGRWSSQKGAHTAIEVACGAGVPIRVAGRLHAEDERYFRAELAPRLGRPGVELVGAIGGAAKAELLGRSRALLFPIQWEEPFGLVMIEAMLCGTPVLALCRGAVPEVVDEGTTGFVCADAAEMVARLRSLDLFDRRRCRARALERFAADRMVGQYLAYYRKAASWTAAEVRGLAHDV